MEKKVKKQATSPLNRMSAWMSGFVQTADKVLSAEKGESKTGKDALVDFLKTRQKRWMHLKKLTARK